MKNLLFAGMIGVLSTGAMAHSPLEGTRPADDAKVKTVPSMVQLDFKGKIRLTRVTVTLADHPSTDLDLGDPKGFIPEYAFPMQAMGDGTYVIDLCERYVNYNQGIQPPRDTLPNLFSLNGRWNCLSLL